MDRDQLKTSPYTDQIKDMADLRTCAYDKNRLRRRSRNCYGSYFSGYVLNGVILASAFCLYCANERFLKSTGFVFFSSYMNDVLAGVIILAISNWLAARDSAASSWVASKTGAFVILAGASFAWEGVSPLLLPWARADILDVAAYFAGGAIYMCLAGSEKLVRFRLWSRLVSFP